MDLPSTAQYHNCVENYRKKMTLNLALGLDDMRPNQLLSNTSLTFDLPFTGWPYIGCLNLNLTPCILVDS